MAFADFDSPRHVLRSSSTSLLASPNPHTAPHSDDYSHSSAPYEDHLGDFIAESRFDEHFGSAVDTSAEFKGLGLDMDIDLGGSDDEDEKPRIGLTYAEGAFEGRGESGAPTRARTRLQSKLGKPHVRDALLGSRSSKRGCSLTSVCTVLSVPSTRCLPTCRRFFYPASPRPRICHGRRIASRRPPTTTARPAIRPRSSRAAFPLPSDNPPTPIPPRWIRRTLSGAQA